MHTPDQIKAAIKDLPELTVEQLAHNFKCALTQQRSGSKVYKPFLDAIERELRKRRKLDDEQLSTEPDSSIV